MKNINYAMLICLVFFCSCFSRDLVTINNAIIENTNTTDIDNLRVDTYEVTIDEYCKYVGDMKSELIRRIRNVNDDITLWPPMGQYPAIVFFDEALQYVENRSDEQGIEIRLPTIDEYKHISDDGTNNTGNVNRGVQGNVKNCAKVDERPFRADDGNKNRFGLFHIMGNATEWASDGDAFGLSWGTCINKKDVDLFPVHNNNGKGISGFRCVADIEK